ncbi:carbamoyl phosphate synthase small subunit [Alkalihalobacillus sp. AL-G]|uniref:carbamoyl phosphate synthase small subunit n=1 Tax=Alkalihalobacillus sp. AL-G TaxID=2926399 RepID=UPI00272CB650|nr:carbamoyl phosphate synthase small subunit [Alkalihalobacillus sp. AL-G]WLD95092.1 carbamoyl phosphate synthase small subunit [Alkalihalobacillus sp. AL-G]
MKRQLILEDGSYYTGTAFGSLRESTGEVVFTTGMAGYQETLSDPSYCDQIITFTYPLIGNYGINQEDFESIEPAAAGVIVSEVALKPSHWQYTSTLDELLKVKDIPGVYDIDTRALTRKIRIHGTLKGKICPLEVDRKQIVQQLSEQRLPADQVKKVSTSSPYTLPGRGKRVVLVDFGAKRGILRELIERGCDVTVVPYDVSADEILRLNPDGVMLSNGPGDPTDVPGAVEMLKEILGKIPVFGICLGHQLLGLACGAKTTKMKFGHRGVNHPVKHLETGKVMITSQNHGYTVDTDGFENLDLDITHIAINDETIEGYRHKVHPAFSVQFHPEASPGPTDSNELFDEFLTMMSNAKNEGVSTCQSV